MTNKYKRKEYSQISHYKKIDRKNVIKQLINYGKRCEITVVLVDH